LTPEAETGANKEEQNSAAAVVQSEEQAGSMQEPAASEQTVIQPEGRRTQLKIVREGVESLTADVWSFRRNHESSIKKLQAEIKYLRKELATHTTSKELSEPSKNSDTGNKKLEKQVASLRAELAGLKGNIAKEAARSRAREEALLSRILAKVSAKPKKPAAKSSKKKR
jgi:cell division protein FtsB